MMIATSKIASCASVKFIFITIIITVAGCSTVHKTEQSFNTKEDLKSKLKGGENHFYIIHLNAGAFLHAKIMQYGIDVIAKVSSADKQYSEQFDTPTGELDAENICLLSETSKDYQIEIIPAQKYADAGEYVIKIIRHAAASERDKRWMAALSSTQQADKMRGKSETRQQSIDQYKSAASEWKALNDMAQYANAMRSLGFVYIRQKNYEEAINTFKSLLSVWKQVSDVRSEGFTHLIIGRIYDLQKDYKTSLAYNLSSLEFWRKVNDFDQETFVLMNIGNLYGHLSDQEKSIDYFEQAL
ncbi:MAG: tetratricopeptide repeat protein, partial [Ginsengibacter sp.]